MSPAPLLIFASACVLGLLGGLHLLCTFRGNQFDPRDAALTAALASVSPIISRETTMARAAKGFHASHSLGALLFALVYGYLALVQPDFLRQSWFLLLLGMATLLSYLALAKLYWFSVPLRGIALANALYAAGLALSLFNP
ncbi:MAG: hypothetical protein V4858_02105 [Pseudomonadota bacterium]